MQKRKLALQAGKFKHVITKIAQSLQTASEIEELESWRDRLNTVAADYENLLMETIATTASDEERDDMMAQQLTVDGKVVELRAQLESEIRLKTARQQRAGVIPPSWYTG